MKTIFYLFFLASPLSAAESADQVAKNIIGAGIAVFDNGLGETITSKVETAAINSQVSLKFLMLGNTVSEELRICYAIGILDRYLAATPEPRSSAADQKTPETILGRIGPAQMKAQRLLLATRLLEIQKPGP